MDVPRSRRNPWPRRLLVGGGALAGLLAGTLGLAHFEPAAPSVERAAIWTDAVKRGPMVRQVRGSGALVPEEIRWVTAASPGRVERIALLPGVKVTADTVLVEL